MKFSEFQAHARIAIALRLEHPVPRLRNVDFLSRLPLACDIHVGIMDPTGAEIFSV